MNASLELFHVLAPWQLNSSPGHPGSTGYTNEHPSHFHGRNLLDDTHKIRERTHQYRSQTSLKYLKSITSIMAPHKDGGADDAKPEKGFATLATLR